MHPPYDEIPFDDPSFWYDYISTCRRHNLPPTYLHRYLESTYSIDIFSNHTLSIVSKIPDLRSLYNLSLPHQRIFLDSEHLTSLNGLSNLHLPNLTAFYLLCRYHSSPIDITELQSFRSDTLHSISIFGNFQSIPPLHLPSIHVLTLNLENSDSPFLDLSFLNSSHLRNLQSLTIVNPNPSQLANIDWPLFPNLKVLTLRSVPSHSQPFIFPPSLSHIVNLYIYGFPTKFQSPIHLHNLTTTQLSLNLSSDIHYLSSQNLKTAFFELQPDNTPFLFHHPPSSIIRTSLMYPKSPFSP